MPQSHASPDGRGRVIWHPHPPGRGASSPGSTPPVLAASPPPAPDAATAVVAELDVAPLDVAELEVAPPAPVLAVLAPPRPPPPLLVAAPPPPAPAVTSPPPAPLAVAEPPPVPLALDDAPPAPALADEPPPDPPAPLLLVDPTMQTPPEQEPPGHALPSGLIGLEHWPVAGSQTPASWQSSEAAQITGLAPMHAPAWQVSSCEQALLSSHAAPSDWAGLEHVPVAGSHAPCAWQMAGCGQTTKPDPVHTPAWHVSVCEHASPSLHAGPVRSLQTPFTSAPAATEHASHGPASQAWSQQNPSTHVPLVHSPCDVHGSP